MVRSLNISCSRISYSKDTVLAGRGGVMSSAFGLSRELAAGPVSPDFTAKASGSSLMSVAGQRRIAAALGTEPSL